MSLFTRRRCRGAMRLVFCAGLSSSFRTCRARDPLVGKGLLCLCSAPCTLLATFILAHRPSITLPSVPYPPCSFYHGRPTYFSLNPAPTSRCYAPCILRRVIVRTTWSGRARDPLLNTHLLRICSAHLAPLRVVRGMWCYSLFRARKCWVE